MADYGELAAEFVAGNKAVETELKRLERAELEAAALERRRVAAERFLEEQKAAAELARAEAARRAEAERVAVLQAEFGAVQHELDGALAVAAKLAGRVLELGAEAFNESVHKTVVEQLRRAVFAGVADPHRRRLLSEIGGQPSAGFRHELSESKVGV